MLKVLSKVKSNRYAILLVTHIAEEADVLCDRITIMINGSFKCVGTPNFLRYEYGNYFDVEIKLKIPSIGGNQKIANIIENTIGLKSEIQQDEAIKVLDAIDFPLSQEFHSSSLFVGFRAVRIDIFIKKIIIEINFQKKNNFCSM